MLFNSYAFILVFLPVALAVFFALGRNNRFREARFWLLLASLGFYSYWNIAYLPVLLGSIVVNFTVASLMSRCLPSSAHAKCMLVVGIAFNLSALSYFKYSN